MSRGEGQVALQRRAVYGLTPEGQRLMADLLKEILLYKLCQTPIVAQQDACFSRLDRFREIWTSSDLAERSARTGS